jgi:hypothetical protein
MPEQIVATYWVSTHDHVRGWWVILINELCSKIQEYGPSVARHLFDSKKVDRNAGNV